MAEAHSFFHSFNPFTAPGADPVMSRLDEDRHHPFPHGADILWGSQVTLFKLATQTSGKTLV